MKNDGDSDTNCIWCAWNSHHRIGKGTERLENKRMRGDLPVYSIIRIRHNTEKSLGACSLIKLSFVILPSNFTLLK